MNFHREFRGDERIFGAGQIAKLAPAEGERVVIENCVREGTREPAQPLGSAREAREPLERSVAAEKFVAALAGQRGLEAGARGCAANPIRVQSVDRRRIHGPNGVIEAAEHFRRGKSQDVVRESQ
jgi:hypothetical protein